MKLLRNTDKRRNAISRSKQPLVDQNVTDFTDFRSFPKSSYGLILYFVGVHSTELSLSYLILHI